MDAIVLKIGLGIERERYGGLDMRLQRLFEAET